MGRRKIDIRPILDERNRSVTLNKRKAGLFKKAHELAVLCQVDLALVVITQEGKVYEYSTAPSATDIFSRRQTLPIVEEKHPVDYGYSSGSHNNLDEDEDSEGEDSANEDGSKHLKSSLLDHSSSRPRLKVHIPLANQESQDGPGQPPGPLTALAVGAGIESAQIGSQHPSMSRGSVQNLKSQAQNPVSTAADALADKHQQLHHPQQQQSHPQPPHRHHQPQTQPYLSQQQYAMPQFQYQQPYMLPHQNQYQNQSPSQHPQSQKHQPKQQNHQAQSQLPQGLALSPGGLYPSYHSTVGYGNVYNTVPYSYGSTSGYGLAPTTATAAPAPAPAPPPLPGSNQQPSSSSSTSSNALPSSATGPGASNAPGAGASGAPNGPSGSGAPGSQSAPNIPGTGAPPPPPPPPGGNNASSSGGGGQGQPDSAGRWSAYPNSPLNYYVPANNDQASVKPEAGPLTASIQARYGNEMMMSPSNLLSMEWGVWDPGSRLVHPAPGTSQPRGTNTNTNMSTTGAGASHNSSVNSSINANTSPNTSTNSTITNPNSKIPSIHASVDKAVHSGEQSSEADPRKRGGSTHELTKNKWQKTS